MLLYYMKNIRQIYGALHRIWIASVNHVYIWSGTLFGKRQVYLPVIFLPGKELVKLSKIINMTRKERMMEWVWKFYRLHL